MKLTELRSQNITVVHGRAVSADPNAPSEDVWKLEITDKDTGDVIWLAFNKQVRDELVQLLMGGIQIADGRIPEVGNGK